MTESEWQTRKYRIDPRLDEAGWPRPKSGTTPLHQPHRSEEHPTVNGPADYALVLDRKVVAIVEAKKVGLDPQTVLTQAERYARGLEGSPYDFHGHKVPFLYATNGELIWFRDVRHPRNRSRQVAAFHTPAALREMLQQDFETECDALAHLPQTNQMLRPYQLEANAKIEEAVARRRREMLVAMATGTGKTYTMVNQIYRLMKSGVAKRVLFLVDRRALAAQAVRAFASFNAEPGRKFDKIYEVYSSRFQTEDFDEDERFDPKLMPQSYLTDPQPKHAYVYVSTIQRMAKYVLGTSISFGDDDEDGDEDAGKLPIPIHAFDAVIADECHRGYTAAEESVWRATLNHFDAIKIGLTATPAAHTTAYFREKVFEYGYEQAVRDGYLVDYNAISIHSEIKLQGVFLSEGEKIERVDLGSGATQIDLLEDERHFVSGDVEKLVTAPDSNRRILEEVKKYTDEHEKQYGRFPKTLIFAVNDLPHASHANQLVGQARELWDRGDDFVCKITGKVDRPLQRIREFRNRLEPGIVVTVDLLSTGVDIPDLELIVFLRPVQSRILFEQMMGRGTRRGERYRDKSYFTVVDCFDGTLLARFREATGITAQPPVKPARDVAELIEDIWQNRDRGYNVRCLVKRLHRIDKQMSGDARQLFAAYIPDGDLARYARELPGKLERDFTGTMKLLRDPTFQDLLVNYPRPQRNFVVAPTAQDTVSSAWLIRDGKGQEYKLEDYLDAFSRFVRENPAEIEAIRILLDRPRDWSTAAVTELRTKLAQSEQRFNEVALQKAFERSHHKALADIISMVQHAADEQRPLFTAQERVAQVFAQITASQTFTDEQQQWLDRIRAHLIENLSIDQQDFELVPVFTHAGGWRAARRVFGERIETLIKQLNEAMAA